LIADACGLCVCNNLFMLKARVAVVTGSRAEFGLLRPVMHAVKNHAQLELAVVAAGSHLISPALTLRDVKVEFDIFDSVPMQLAGKTGRIADAESLGRGISRFTRVFERLQPDWVVVLGDRIEAFAAASTASIGGWALAHIHGGDRAEGIADEAMRHAITKLAHLHFPATEQSRERIVRMGESLEFVFNVGSPAIDELGAISAMSDAEYEKLGAPRTVFLLHPSGRDATTEGALAARVLAMLGAGVLALHPNHDAGRDGILAAIQAWTKGVGKTDEAGRCAVEHLPRDRFVGLLKRLATVMTPHRGVLIGNSSAGLIEAAALGVPVVDIGRRQAGRERPRSVFGELDESTEAIRAALAGARAMRAIGGGVVEHPYGDGRASERIADVLSRTDAHAAGLLRKHCSY